MFQSDHIALDMIHHLAQGPNPTTVQSLIFDADEFSVGEAKAWAKSHGFVSSSVDTTEGSIRLRQKDPSGFARNSFRTIELDDGVKAVIGKIKQHKDVRASIDVRPLDFGNDGVEKSSPNTAPTAFRIWKAGENPTDHGMTIFSERSAQMLMAEQEMRGNLYSIDVDHASLKDDSPIENKKAVGWHRLEIRDGTGGKELWAVNLEWTEIAKSGLEKDPPEWRYFSPAYRLDPDTQEVVSYLNTSITINPATWNNTALASRGASLETSQMKMEDIKAALAAMADADDADEADKKMAKKMMAAMEDEGDKDSSMPPPKDSSAPPPPPKKDEADDDADTRASAAYAAVAAKRPAASEVELATRVYDLECKLAAYAEKDERRELLASRPDLVKSSLKSWLMNPETSLASIKEVCANAPKPATKATPAAAAQVTGTRGDVQGEAAYVPPTEKSFIDAHMGFESKKDSIRKEGNKLVLAAMGSEEAKEFLAKKNGAASAKDGAK